MYRKILVPLDGSELAECVLPHVKAVASGCGAEHVILLRVAELPFSGDLPPVGVAELVQKASVKAAEEYLARVKAQLSKEGLSVEAKVLVGRPAETISEFAQADRIVRSSSVPILLIRPKGCGSAT
jgi:nucleotide-binding universal stress UspA family protein